MSTEAKGWLALAVFVLALVVRPVASRVVELVAMLALAVALWCALTMVRRAE
jgi:hypothetical protein